MLLVVAPLDVGAHVEVAQVVPQDRGDPRDGVVDLALDEDQQRVVPRPRVGSGHEEQVRVAVRVDALVRLCAAGPFVGQRAAAEPGDRVRRPGQVHVVTGGEHDGVEVVLDAVAGADAHRAHRGDRPVDELAVVALQRRVVVAGDQHPLAARREVRGQLAAQPRVLDLSVQMGLAQPGDQPRSAGSSTPARSRWPRGPRTAPGGQAVGRQALSRTASAPRQAWRRRAAACTQPGVRWKTLTKSACFTSSGTIWTALAPVPMTATRLPVKS